MRILYLTQYYPPEVGATQTRAVEICRHLAGKGHDITVITEVPNHPAGIIKSEYRGKLFKESFEDDIRVIRIWVRCSPKKNFGSRILFYTSFMINSIIAGLLLTTGHFDIIYATSPPLFVAWAGVVLSRLKRTKFVFEVRDLWPESAVALGELKNRYFISLAEKMENYCYKKAELIIVVTEGIQQNLIDRRIDPKKVRIIPNGSNVQLFKFQRKSRERLRKQLEIEGKLVVIYAGIFGIAQGLEIIVESGELLREYAEIIFLMIGEGPNKCEISRLIKEKNLTNFLVLDEQPREIIPEFLSTADIALIPLRNINLFKGALPSKIFDAWACERPIILMVDGEAHKVLDDAGGGKYVQPESSQQLACTIEWFQENHDSMIKMGKKGRYYTEKYYSRKKLSQQLEKELLSITQK